jgi:4-amino-4-deoxy-L-arabinose transferase-like glycosyltransferase
MVLINLTDYPLTWFDEGSHLHVPKTLVRFGVYADYSSEGFRYYGPTIGVGPTVMLPIAGTFKVFGIGLMQARLVVALYLLAALFVFYRLARHWGGPGFAWLAIALLISSRSAGVLLYGRQVLGEIPGLFFLVTGLWIWFAAWERARWPRLVVVGLMLGLAMITKYQYLLFIAPSLLLAWLTNLIYYRTAPQRAFILPGLVAGASFAVWQGYLVMNLGPATAGENLAALREATAGAAMSFSPALMQQSLNVLISLSTYFGGLLPILVYGFFLALPRRREAQQWGIVLTLIVANLGWYVVASIGWWRYAFLGLALASLFVARFFYDLTDGLHVGLRGIPAAVKLEGAALRNAALRLAMVGWLLVMILLPLAQTVREIAFPAFNAPEAMAEYLNKHVPLDALVETWEPEMGFLTDHNYHFPPARLLAGAVSQAFLQGAPVAQDYDFVQRNRPDYVLVGNFARGTSLYPGEQLEALYQLETRIGGYELHKARVP